MKMMLLKETEWTEMKEKIWSDYMVISQSELLKRMSGVTQVISYPTSKYTTNRMSHSLMLLGFVEEIAEELGLSVKLCMTAALAHDLGHICFGHDGEYYEREYLSDPEFNHGKNGVRICQLFGIHLNPLVAESVAAHSDGDMWINVEFPDDEYKWILSKVLVAISDDIVCFSDLRDIIVEKTSPKALKVKAVNAMNKVLGMAGEELLTVDCTDLEVDQALSDILGFYAKDIISQSRGKNGIMMSKQCHDAFKEMKNFVYREFHKTTEVLESRKEVIGWLKAVQAEAERILLMQNYNGSELGARISDFLGKAQYGKEVPSVKRMVVDFITTCTDQDIKAFYEEMQK